MLYITECLYNVRLDNSYNAYKYKYIFDYLLYLYFVLKRSQIGLKTAQGDHCALPVSSR